MIDLKSRKAAAMVVVVDFLLAVLLMQQAILSLTTINKSKSPPRIETLGYYAIEITWPENNNDDVDLYVQDPSGHIAYFANTQAGLMHLERDDLGRANDIGLRDVKNEERIILRGCEVGEYTVNIHMYAQNTSGPVKVTIKFYRLRGNDKLIQEETITLHDQTEEKTAFRFTLNNSQDVTDVNHLEKHFIGGSGFTE